MLLVDSYLYDLNKGAVQTVIAPKDALLNQDGVVNRVIHAGKELINSTSPANTKTASIA